MAGIRRRGRCILEMMKAPSLQRLARNAVIVLSLTLAGLLPATLAQPQTDAERWAELLKRGTEQARAQNWKDAAADYRQAIAAKPDDPVAHFDLGNALAALGESDEAIQEYREALRRKPDLA